MCYFGGFYNFKCWDALCMIIVGFQLSCLVQAYLVIGEMLCLMFCILEVLVLTFPDNLILVL